MLSFILCKFLTLNYQGIFQKIMRPASIILPERNDPQKELYKLRIRIDILSPKPD